MNKQGFVFSPSNMSTYELCPRKFQGQSITKEIKWQATSQKSRGSLVHTGLDKAVRHGIQAVSTWPEGVDPVYVTQQVNDTRRQVVSGAQMFIEHELTVNEQLKPTGWWDDDAFIRAKADLVVLPTPQETSLTTANVIDFKTGKHWDKNNFQLRVEALLLYLIYQRPIINYAYWYVDQGHTVEDTIDFRNGLHPVKDIIDLIKQMKQAIQDNYFPPKKNSLCKWRSGQCQLYGKCGL